MGASDSIPGAQTSSYEEIQSFRFEGADIDTVMTQYCEWTEELFKNRSSAGKIT